MEKKSKTVQPVTKIEAQKIVEELKKNSKAAKLEAKEENSELLEKSESIKKENEKTGNPKRIARNNQHKNVFQKIESFFMNMTITFAKSEATLKICVVVPVLIILIIIGNKIYSETGRQTLTCTYGDSSPIVALEQELTIQFKRNSIYIFSKKITYKEQNEKWKSVEDIEKEILEKIEETKNTKGVELSYEKTENTITMMEKYNYYKLSSSKLKEFNLESEATLEELKSQYEDYGYTCTTSSN